MTQTHILILAAGASSRMRGADKLLERLDDQPQIRRIALAALATGLPVAVALPPDRPARAAALAGLSVALVVAENAAGGMAESLKAGLAALPDDAAVLLVLADLPEITTDDLSAVLAAGATAPGLIHRGTAEDGRPGHPVLFPPWARADLAALQGDEGARHLLARHGAQVRPVPLPGTHAITDLDTPEDWVAFRALRGQ